MGPKFVRWMTKNRILLVALSGVIVLVIGIIFGWLLSPSGQVWRHDWLGQPDGLTAIATVGAAIGTVGAVIVALFGIRYERKKAKEDRVEAQKRFEAEQTRAREELKEERERFKQTMEAERKRFDAERNEFKIAQEEGRKQFLESQQQTREALEEGRRQFLEAQYAANRPLVIPVEPDAGEMVLSKHPAQPPWNAQQVDLKIRNVGTGIATNVWGIYMPPDPMPNSTYQFSHRLAAPLSAGEGCTAYFTKGTLFNCDDKIGGYTLCIPKERAPELGFADTTDRRDRCVGRLTLTYHDIFGRKHASIFDFTQTFMWVCIACIPNITQDLGEMDEAKGIELFKEDAAASLYPELT